MIKTGKSITIYKANDDHFIIKSDDKRVVDGFDDMVAHLKAQFYPPKKATANK